MGQIPRKVAFPMNNPANNAYWETQNNVLAHQISYGSVFGNTGIDNNMSCFMATGTTPGTPDIEFVINHNITQRIPIFFFYLLDQAGDLYTYYMGMTDWTFATSAGNDGAIYLKCSVASANYRVIIF